MPGYAQLFRLNAICIITDINMWLHKAGCWELKAELLDWVESLTGFLKQIWPFGWQ